MRLACLCNTVPSFDFIRFRYIGYGLSALLIVVSVAAVLLGGLRYGVDFAGGAMVQLDFERPIDGTVLKERFVSAGLSGLTVQQFGAGKTGWLVRFALPTDMTNERAYTAVVRALQSIEGNQAAILRQETVGPKVGENLRCAALEAFFYVMLLLPSISPDALNTAGGLPGSWPPVLAAACSCWAFADWPCPSG